tara:strand:+ start:637 stop:1164 length:528 start_codon:yes stop_codon:yes gene_type:complete
MINKLKINIFLIMCALTLIACSSKSEKGKWSKNDMKKCIDEWITEVNNDADAMKGVEMLNVNIEDAADCACKKAEELYESYKEAIKEEEKMSNEEETRIYAECVGLGNMDSTDGGWTEEAKKGVLQGCNDELPGYEEYCECALSELMEKYSFYELVDLGDEEYEEIGQECFQYLE